MYMLVNALADRKGGWYQRPTGGALALEERSRSRAVDVDRALTSAEAETGAPSLNLYIGEKGCWSKSYDTEATLTRVQRVPRLPSTI
jgi:hypothetical protein